MDKMVHLINRPKWDHFITINWASEHWSSICPVFKWFWYFSDSHIPTFDERKCPIIRL
jgi:hypothetical protein